MNAATKSAVSTLLAADPSVSPDCIPVALGVLDGKTHAPSPTGQPVRLLSQKEYAARWKCTVRTVQRWIEMGEVKAIKRGRIVRIPVPEDEF
ncbi:helix-turn-helix domain-containing protein [Pontiellaceae bacterium B1224]|nr:helix-turn-helix domain-containing protein [Pontiellaceae bacterium B1224]